MPSYKEINPTLFTITTFPFLYGVMFGDMGHGSLLMIFSLFLIFHKINKNKPSFLDDLFEARYILVCMAFFSIFCGFMYNDFFGMSLDLFGSCYHEKTIETVRHSHLQFSGGDLSGTIIIPSPVLKK